MAALWFVTFEDSPSRQLSQPPPRLAIAGQDLYLTPAT
jgi:hypothetical protein